MSLFSFSRRDIHRSYYAINKQLGVTIMRTLIETLFTVIMLGKTGLNEFEDVEKMGVNIA